MIKASAFAIIRREGYDIQQYSPPSVALLRLPRGRKGLVTLWDEWQKIVLSGFMGTSSVASLRMPPFPSGARLYGAYPRRLTVRLGETIFAIRLVMPYDKGQLR